MTVNYEYHKLFDPDPLLQDFREAGPAAVGPAHKPGDQRDGKLYLYNDDIVLAVNVALATGRPLLVSGPSGGGKSSLAFNVARVLQRRYYEFVVTSRTQAQDLLWNFDAVRRLADATTERLHRATGAEPVEPAAAAEPAGVATSDDPFETYYRYIEPRELWWIFDRELAARRGRPAGPPAGAAARDPAADRFDPPQAQSAVLLIDEIDKADPDVPNNLLVALGSLEFDVTDVETRVRFQGDATRWQERPLVIITTNRERPLPKPFLRRCVVLDIADPQPERLLEIARSTFGATEDDLYARVLTALQNQQPAAGSGSISIAEYLDTVRAAIELRRQGEALPAGLLDDILDKTVWKEGVQGR